jgi:hypothetical protein
MDGQMDRRKRTTLRNRISIIPLFCLLTCSNPASEDEKNVVKTLIDEPLPVGRYEVFWDGTDSDNKPMPAGNYKARLDTWTHVSEINMTALEGTAGKSNDSSEAILLPQLVTQIDLNHPEPFHIRDGTNIRFSNSENTHVQLTIRKP